MPLETVFSEGDGVESIGLRRALGRFATGVAVVATRSPEGKFEGLTANSFASVSLDPPLVLWSLRRNATSFDSFSRAGHFSVNILGADQRDVALHFAARKDNKFDSFTFMEGHGGCPIIPGSIATFECRAETTVDGGDHLIFVGRIIQARAAEGEPLIFNAGRFCRSAELIDVT
jgi:flavin reductase (DIM6/NTAB) family NADH-FMN oxidoreductase RutF